MPNFADKSAGEAFASLCATYWKKNHGNIYDKFYFWLIRNVAAFESRTKFIFLPVETQPKNCTTNMSQQPFSVSKETNSSNKQRSWIANALRTAFIAKEITSFTSSWACGSFSFFDASSTLTRASRFLVKVCWACCHVLYTRRRSWKQAYGKKKLVFRHEKITQKKKLAR